MGAARNLFFFLDASVETTTSAPTTQRDIISGGAGAKNVEVRAERLPGFFRATGGWKSGVRWLSFFGDRRGDGVRILLSYVSAARRVSTQQRNRHVSAFLGSKEVDLTSVLLDDGRNAPKRLPFVVSSFTAVHGGGVLREVFPKLLLQPFRVDVAEDPSIFD